MIKKIIHAIILSTALSLFFGNTVLAATDYAKKAREDGKLIICIDAGHGGSNTGATAQYEGTSVTEKDLNLRLAKFLKEELLKYEDVNIIMTRTTDTALGNGDRADYAQRNLADYIISVHNNQSPNGANAASGSCVLVPVSTYQPASSTVPDIYHSTENIGLSVLSELKKLGLGLTTDQSADLTKGLVRRPHSPEGWAKSTSYYPDGSVADYYGLIRRGVRAGIPTLIIEHAYVDNANDYNTYLSTDAKLKKLAKADATGIATALALTLIE